MIDKIATTIANVVAPKVIALIQVQYEAIAAQALQNAFTAFDRNKDGKVDINDFLKW